MKRRLFTFFAGLSAILFLAFAALFIRGFWKADRLEYANDHRASMWRGTLVITWPDTPLSHFKWAYASAPTQAVDRDVNHWPPPEISFIGFRYFRFRWMSAYFIPSWFLLLSTTVLPLCWLWRRHRTRHLPREEHFRRCPKCGYDLRAHELDARCPECGTVATPDKIHR